MVAAALEETEEDVLKIIQRSPIQRQSIDYFYGATVNNQQSHIGMKGVVIFWTQTSTGSKNDEVFWFIPIV